MMRRREFIAGLGSAAAWPLAARAQQSVRKVVAFLTNASFEGWAERLRAFREALSQAGFAESRNLTIEFHPAEGDENRLSALTAELVRRRVDVIVTNGTATSVAKAATPTIPIVFLTGGDPVEMGFVASLSRPGGNLTGITGMSDALGPKRLELLHDIVPTAVDIGVLSNPTNGTEDIQLKDLTSAAGLLGLRLHVMNVYAERQIEGVFASLVNLRVGGLVTTITPIFNNYAAKLGTLAMRHAIPAVYSNRDFVAGGSVASLGPDLIEQFHWMGVWTARVLRGESPAGLSIYRSTKIQVMINMKSAKALGLTIPLSLLGRADEVIE